MGPLQDDVNLEDVLPGFHGVITSSLHQFTAEVMDLAPDLLVIGRPGIGLDNIDLAAATERGIAVVHTPDGPTEPVAEMVLGFLIMLAHKLPQADRHLRRHGFPGRYTLLGQDLVGKTLGLVGLGRIGGRVAGMCRAALGMRVLAYDPYVDPERARALGAELMDDLHTLLAQADFVSVHVPLTPETRGLVGSAELAAMKPTAYLINTSRGPVVDEKALVQALREGRIAGAALDVFDPEPPSPDNPLFELENVIVTPHIGSYTEEGVWRMSMGAVEQVLQVLRGERPAHLANPEVWQRRRPHASRE